MATLSEIRAEHPEYQDMNDAALANAIYAQFYSDMPRGEFDRKIGLVPNNSKASALENAVKPVVDYVPTQRQMAQEGMDRSTSGATDVSEALAEPHSAAGGVKFAKGVGKAALGALEYVTSPINAALRTFVGKPVEDVTGIPKEYTEFAAGTALGMTPLSKGVPVPKAPRPAGGAVTLEELGKDAAAADASRAASEAPQTVAAAAVDKAAADATAAGKAAAAAPNRAGNVNLDRVWAPEDVKDAIRQAAADNADFIAARRGTVTQAETRDMANMLGMSGDDLMKRQAGQAFNAEEMFAAREVLVSQAGRVRDLSRRAVGGSDADKAEFAKEITRLVAIQEQVAGATAEAGRALAQFRMMAGSSKDELARIVEASKASGIDDMARMVADLDDPAKVAVFARNAFKAKTSDMLLEGWINALLSGPTTHAANVLSNSLVAAWSIPEAATAAAISKLTGSGIGGREVFERTFGLLEGAKDGIRAAARAYRTEQPSDLATKIETRKFQAIPSVNVGGVEIGGKQVRIPGRLLTAEDEFFKAINYRSEINALALRQAQSEGLGQSELAERVAQLKASPTEAMQEAARTAAEKATFTNPLGAVGKGLTDMARAAPAIRVVMPFIRTPINLVKFAAERSPFGLLFKDVRANLAGANGPIARDNQIARLGLGSMVSATAAYMASDGTITGGGPSDAAKRALMRADGWQPYSVKIGNTHYSYSRFEPLGTLMGVAADFVEMNDQLKTDEKANVAALLMGSVSRNLVSKTWMKGPADLIEAVEDPERYGPRYVQRLVGTLVPTGIAQYANANDPYLREARNVLDAVRARIPGEREKLFVRRDAFGEPIKREGALGPDLLSPVYQSAARNDPTIAEMLRLRVTPGTLDRNIRNTELNSEEFDTYSNVAGHTMKRTLDALVASPQWRDMPEAAQVEAMHDVIRQSRDVARSVVFANHPDLPLRVATETLKRKRVPQPTP